MKIVSDYGTVFFYNEKKELHREDGPAVEYTNGDKEYYLNNLLHRVDGPAIERLDENDYYFFILDEEYSYEDWLAIKDFPLLW